MRPLNFSPPNLQKNVWNDISTYENKTGWGRWQQKEGQRAQRWLIKTKPGLRYERQFGHIVQTDPGFMSRGCWTSLFPSLAKSQHMLENQWPSLCVRGVVAAREGVSGG